MKDLALSWKDLGKKKSLHNIRIFVGRVASLLELLRVNWNKVSNSLNYVS